MERKTEVEKVPKKVAGAEIGRTPADTQTQETRNENRRTAKTA